MDFGMLQECAIAIANTLDGTHPDLADALRLAGTPRALAEVADRACRSLDRPPLYSQTDSAVGFHRYQAIFHLYRSALDLACAEDQADMLLCCLHMAGCGISRKA